MLIDVSDDGLCLLSWALAVANAGVMYKFIQVNYIGYHIWDVPDQTIEDKVFSGKLSMAQQLLYNPILCLVKASIIIFLIRLGDQRKKIRYSFSMAKMANLFWCGQACAYHFLDASEKQSDELTL